jgi:hypothetical protein
MRQRIPALGLTARALDGRDGLGDDVARPTGMAA